MSFKTLRIFLGLALVVFLGSGCATHTASLRDTGDVYGKPLIPNAPKIILADLFDNRSHKGNIGQISALVLQSNKPINEVVTNRIAAQLREMGYNVQKTNVSNRTNVEELKSAVQAGNGNAYVSGDLEKFYIASFDALMEKAKGEVIFSIKVHDPQGAIVFDKNYVANAEHYIGLSGQWGSEKLIEDTIQAAVDKLTSDGEFNDLLSKTSAIA